MITTTIIMISVLFFLTEIEIIFQFDKFHGPLIAKIIHLAVFESRNRNFDLTLTKELNLLWPPIHFKMYLIIQTKWCVMFLQYPRDLWLLMDFWSTCFKFEITWSRSSLLASLCTNFPTNSDSYVIGPKNLKWMFSTELSRHGNESMSNAGSTAGNRDRSENS